MKETLDSSFFDRFLLVLRPQAGGRTVRFLNGLRDAGTVLGLGQRPSPSLVFPCLSQHKRSREEKGEGRQERKEGDKTHSTVPGPLERNRGTVHRSSLRSHIYLIKEK